jgi:hypothetical protein
MKTSRFATAAWSARAGYVIAGLLLAGCATHKQAKLLRVNPPGMVEEYDQVVITGSYIPVKIPRSPTARIDPSISPITIMSRDQFQQEMGGRSPMH